MKFVDTVDYGAPEFVVSGVGAVERISDGMVQVTLYRRRSDEKPVACSLVWDRQEWQKFVKAIKAARDV